MVKSHPRLQTREERKKWRLQRNQQQQQHKDDQIQTQLTPKTPESNPLKKRPSSSSPSSFPPSPPLFSSPESNPPKKRLSLSSPESHSSNPTTPDPPTTHSLSGNGSFSDPRKPNGSDFPSIVRSLSGQLPPLPPLPSKQLLRRTVSDPVPFGSTTPPPPPQMVRSASPGNSVTLSSLPGSGSTSVKTRSTKKWRRMSKKMGQMKKMVQETAMGRASQSQSANICTMNEEDDDNDKGKAIRERVVEAERLSEDWIMIKINCQCGSDYQCLISEAERKCYYKLV